MPGDAGSQPIEIQVDFGSSKPTSVVIEITDDQGGPIDGALDWRDASADPQYSVDVLVLLDRSRLVRALAGWARTVEPGGRVRVECVESRLPRMLELLDPDNTGVRPIVVKASD